MSSGDRRDRYTMPGFDASEDELVEFINKDCYEDWKAAYRPWERQTEENIRMLSGRQHDVFIESTGSFEDLSKWLVPEHEAWRQFPTFNWLLTYFKQTLSKLTENIPVMGAMPATADVHDAMLAEIVEPIWKYEWDQTNMPEHMFDLYGWVLTAGRGILKMRWEPSRGPKEAYVGPALLTGIDPTTGEVIERPLSQAPYVQGSEGLEPNFLTDEVGNVLMDENGEPVMGPPDVETLGDIQIDVVPPTSVITPHGPEPFSDKPWYTHEYYMPVELARERFDMPELEPDENLGENDFLLKVSFGTHFGMPGAQNASRDVATRGMIKIREHWRRASYKNDDFKFGRLTIVSKDKLLYDDINPYVVPGIQHEAIIGFYAFDLTKLPFRQEGTTDFEFLNPLQRATNRRLGGLLESTEYNEQPLTIISDTANLEDQMDQLNRPGATVVASYSGLGKPVERLPAVEIPQGSVQMLDILQGWMYLLGSANLGSEGSAVTADASGELQREVRFDADRPWGATLRRHSYIWARVAQDMLKIIGVAMDDERVLAISGEDNAWKFLHVRPQLFAGRVNVRPMPESAVIESRQDKQNRILNLYQLQMIPPDVALSQLGYPDLVRLTRPGGEAYALSQRENAEMTQGVFADVLPEHDHMIHLNEHKKVQQTAEYRNMPEGLRNIFRAHIALHEAMLGPVAVHDAQVVAPAVQAQSALAMAGSPELQTDLAVASARSGPTPGNAPQTSTK